MPNPILDRRVLLTSRAAPAAFSPSDISGLVLWLKADSLSLNDGDAVATWADSSGVGNDATQGTAGNRPTFKTGILNGKPVVRFDGSSDVLNCGSSFTVKHIFVVAKYNGATFSDYQGLVTMPGTTLILTGNSGLATWYDDSGVATVYHRNGSALAESNMTGPMNAWAVMSISATDGWTGIPQIGDDRSNARYWPGDMAEILLYSSVLSSTDRERVEEYLNGRWAVY